MAAEPLADVTCTYCYIPGELGRVDFAGIVSSAWVDKPPAQQIVLVLEPVQLVLAACSTPRLAVAAAHQVQATLSKRTI